MPLTMMKNGKYVHFWLFNNGTARKLMGTSHKWSDLITDFAAKYIALRENGFVEVDDYPIPVRDLWESVISGINNLEISA